MPATHRIDSGKNPLKASSGNVQSMQKKNNMTLLGTYVDRALSARTADRPDFQRMIADSSKGLFDIVLV